jgi:glucose-1-phosphate cytidylyltransferase
LKPFQFNFRYGRRREMIPQQRPIIWDFMKVVILAGGLGSRISEEADTKPKPMIEIGNRPILWHIMKIYAAFGLTEFVICVGYKGYLIKEFFANYALHTADITFDLAKNSMEVHQQRAESWRVTLVDTGENTQTGGRLRRVAEYIGKDDFCLTYGDGLASIDIGSLVNFHKHHGRLATVTAVQSPGRFGALVLQGDRATDFVEKPLGDGAWISGGFFVLSPKTIGYIAGDTTVWEHDPLQNLARNGEMMAYKHNGFWHPMDTLRDRRTLEELWRSGTPPWKLW